MTPYNKYIRTLITVLIFITLKINAQEVNVIDKKGTIQTVKNTRVFTGIANKPANVDAIIGDIYFDQYPNPNSVEIWDGALWKVIKNNTTHTGTTGSIFFADLFGAPTEDNSELFWDNLNNRLGIGNNSPSQSLHITNNMRLEGQFFDENDQTGTPGQILSSTATGTDWINNPALNNWLITGNSGTTAANFLGTTDDVKMQIRSNNLPILEFGRRQTLGLVQTYPDYTSVDQPLVYLRGNNDIAALQFAASGASFYKPMFFTTTNGSFRLKGSSGSTDLFELGSAGPANEGRLEFTVGDDGNEPMIFKRYFYSPQIYREFFRVQGSTTGRNAKTRFGININQHEIPIANDIDANYNTGNFNIANSTLQIEGSVSKSIISVSTDFTLTEDHYTLVATNTSNTRTINLPAPNGVTGRIYIIKTNRNRGVNLNITYINSSYTGSNAIGRRSVVQLQSDGSSWLQIN